MASQVESAEEPGIRVVLDLVVDAGSVSGTLTTGLESRPFWGWLELMSELERAADGSGTEPDVSRAIGS